MAHNGVINQFLKESSKDSDSYAFFEEFNKLFIKNSKIITNRQQNIKTTLKELFKEDKGFYSIFILDRKENKGYYFKDRTTEIHIYKSKDKNFLFITTSKYNHDLATLIKTKFKKEYKIEERVLYKIDFEKLEVYKIGEFEKCENKHYCWSVNSVKKENNTTQQHEINNGPAGTLAQLRTADKNNPHFLYNLHNADFEMCDYCGKEITTDVFFKDNCVLCAECLNAIVEEDLSEDLV